MTSPHPSALAGDFAARADAIVESFGNQAATSMMGFGLLTFLLTVGGAGLIYHHVKLSR